MRLHDYLELKKITYQQCAVAIGVHLGHVYCIVAGDCFPKINTLRAIERFT